MNPERWQQVRGILDKAIALGTSERISYLENVCAGDLELHAEVESLLGSHEQAGSIFLNTPAVDLKNAIPDSARKPDRGGSRIGVYQIMEEIGHGGMGEVYRAVRADGQYDKQVAIKLVRGGFDTSFVLERFRQERQILASLDHPNIARLHDGGTTEDGVPYLVMELIGGVPIDQYCEEHDLDIAQRLQLFKHVCAAVQYAHQRLVIHRDIKPANILVTVDSVPKLLDFGIAKLLGPNAAGETTLVGSMTPDYASPEQIRGEAITTATDVYSLGVVLYRLLTGRSPYQENTHAPHELARVICEVEPLRPSTANLPAIKADALHFTAGSPSSKNAPGSSAKLRRQLAGDLDNIILKALRKEPERRYASVGQLAEDIRRHLQGLPVSAAPDSFPYRAGKFVRRHKLGIALTALLLIAVMSGIGATLYEARIATANERRAERRFNDVRKLANSLLFEIHDSIQDLPGATQSRKLLIKRALEYLDSLAQESTGDPSLQRELAAAYARIGDLQIYRGAQEEKPERLTSYKKALAIRETLHAANPNEREDAVALADSSRQMAEAFLDSGQPATALPYVEQAVQISEQSAQKYPNDVKVLQELAHDYAAQGNVLAGDFSWSNLGDNQAAIAVRNKQVAAATRVVELQPNVPTSRRIMADGHIMLGDQLLMDGQRRAAQAQYLLALEVMQELLTHMQSAQLLNDADALYQRLGSSAMADGDAKKAEAASHKALEMSQKLTLADPHNVWAQVMFAEDNARFAQILSMAGKQKEAMPALQKALSNVAQVTALNPESTDALGEQADISVVAGGIFKQLGDRHRSLHYYRDAVDIYLRVQTAQPINSGVKLKLAASYNLIGATLLQERDFKTANEMYRKALDLEEPETQSGHSNEEALYATASSYAGLGEVAAIQAATANQDKAQQFKQRKEARKWYERSSKTWARIKEPGLISPSGFECVSKEEVNRQLAHSEKIFAQLE